MRGCFIHVNVFLTQMASALVAVPVPIHDLLTYSRIKNIQRSPAVDFDSSLEFIHVHSSSGLLQNLLLTSLVDSDLSSDDQNPRPSAGLTNPTAPSFYSWEKSLSSTISKFDNDEVVRIMDPNTVKLKKAGLVSFASIRTPSGYSSSSDNFRFPDCLAKSPVSKAKFFLPQGAQVRVKVIGDATSGNKMPALIVSKSTGKLVNAELVREGFARPTSRGRDAAEAIIPGLAEGLKSLQKQAEMNGVGMYKQCDLVEKAADDQFEPLDMTVETRYGDDGGKQVLRPREEVGIIPSDPGDVRKCADFDTFEDALRWYDRYFPFYGDVAKLDRDGDGVPCSGLPHTTNQDRYRMKKPTNKMLVK